MTWVKLDDRFAEHPKVVDLSNRAFRLYVSALCYCARHLTDGEIATAHARALDASINSAVDAAGRQHARSNGVSNAAAAIKELVTIGLWESTAKGYVIHDYLRYNPSRAQVLATREHERHRWQLRAGAPANSEPTPPRSEATPGGTPAVPSRTRNYKELRSRAESTPPAPAAHVSEVLDGLRMRLLVEPAPEPEIPPSPDQPPEPNEGLPF